MLRAVVYQRWWRAEALCVAVHDVEEAVDESSEALEWGLRGGQCGLLPALSTGKKPFLGLLVVRGDLIVEGLYQDSLDPDSIVIVTGNLVTDRLISQGFFEVHCSVLVKREALWLGNDGGAEIFGDLRAGFVFTKYHSVRVHGRIEAPLVLGDSDHFTCKAPYEFVEETDENVKDSLLAVMPRPELSIEGEVSRVLIGERAGVDEEDEWCIDYVDADVLRKMVASGKPVLSRPRPPKKA